MSKRDKGVGEIKLFVTHLMNELQDNYSNNLSIIKQNAMGTKFGDDLIQLITKVYEGQNKVLNDVFKKIQEIQ